MDYFHKTLHDYFHLLRLLLFFHIGETNLIVCSGAWKVQFFMYPK